MGKYKDKKIHVKVEFSDGYQERFTNAIMKIYEKRIRKGEPFQKDNKSV